MNLDRWTIALIVVALVAIVIIFATMQPWSDPGAAYRLVEW